MHDASSNIDPKTVAGFGDEWESFDQLGLNADGHRSLFEAYFGIFPFCRLPADAEGFDMGCGSGRWADLASSRVGILHCIDPSERALDVARRRLGDRGNVRFHCATSDTNPLEDGSQDFGYSLGVLHHIPDTQSALLDCTRKLKPGAPFLLYLYYRFDGRPAWFRALWKASDAGRRTISMLPFPWRKAVANVIATTVYWPLATVARMAERRGRNTSAIPLSFYRNCSFYTMRTDALDRFGTRLEHRFTKDEIARMMTDAGLTDIVFSDREPHWVACGIKGA